MKHYTKNIIIVACILGGIFYMLYSTGGSLIQKFMPDTQVASNTKRNSAMTVGSTMPYFDLYTLDQTKISTTDLKGYPVLITFWATWNSESVDQIKILDDYTKQYSKTNRLLPVRIVTINSQEPSSTAGALIRRGGYILDVLSDQSGSVGTEFGIKTLPTSFFVDKNGIIKNISVGTLSEKEIVDKLDTIIN